MYLHEYNGFFTAFLLMMFVVPQNLKKSMRLIFNCIHSSSSQLAIVWLFLLFLLADLQHERDQNLCSWSLMSQPRSFTLAGSKLSRPLLPKASWSGSWHISFVNHVQSFLISENVVKMTILPWLSFTSTLLPRILTISENQLYILAWMFLLAWSLMRNKIANC